MATLNQLLDEGYRLFPGNPILCLAVKKGRDDRSAANVLRLFLERQWRLNITPSSSNGRADGTQQGDGDVSETGQDSVERTEGEGTQTEERQRAVPANGNAPSTSEGDEKELAQSLAEARDEDNYTALHWAARNNFAECTQLLIEKGRVDTELRGTRTAVTALHLASNFGYENLR